MSILYIELTTTCKLELFLYFNLEINKLRTVDLKLSVCWNRTKRWQHHSHSLGSATKKSVLRPGSVWFWIVQILDPCPIHSACGKE